MKPRFLQHLIATAVLAMLVPLAGMDVPPAGAAGDLPALLQPELGKVRTKISWEGTLYPSRRIDRTGGDFAATRHDLSLQVPVRQNSDDEWTVAATVRHDGIETEATLPDTGERFPADLWDMRFGAAYRHRHDDGRISGGFFSLGSASDKPFNSSREDTVQVSGFLRLPSGERNAWLLLLSYSNNREFLNHVPLPGIAYSWSPSDKFSGILGIPYLWLSYKPQKDVTLQASYLPVRTVHAEAAWKWIEKCSLFAAFDWSCRRYLRAGRTDSEHGLFYYEKRAGGGVRLETIQDVFLELEGGYAFDRFYFEGKDYSDRDRNRLDIHDGPYSSARLTFQF
ncbi:MAG TPA: hypothetical protein PLB96_03240 [Syntrophales bacterium]|nr:hypothetical protein [Syntrophales bacterium]